MWCCISVLAQNTACVCAKEGVHTHVLNVKGRLFRTNTACTSLSVLEKYHMCLQLSKNPISFLPEMKKLDFGTFYQGQRRV